MMTHPRACFWNTSDEPWRFSPTTNCNSQCTKCSTQTYMLCLVRSAEQNPFWGDNQLVNKFSACYLEPDESNQHLISCFFKIYFNMIFLSTSVFVIAALKDYHGLLVLNVIFQHPVALYRSDLGVSASSKYNVVHCSFIRHYFTTCFGLTDHLQVYRCCGHRFTVQILCFCTLSIVFSLSK
jgi:hypothetical protein